MSGREIMNGLVPAAGHAVELLGDVQEKIRTLTDAEFRELMAALAAEPACEVTATISALCLGDCTRRLLRITPPQETEA